MSEPHAAETSTRRDPETVCITIQRPPHVHFYRHAIRALEDSGRTVHVFVRDSQITTALLDRYGIDYTVLADHVDGGSLPRLARMQATYELRLLRAVRAIQPDVITGIGGVAAAHVSSLTDARSVVFTDTEHATLSNALMKPFADEIWTPACFGRDFGAAHVRYPSYHELAYLHPERFEPDPGVLDAADVDPDRPLAVVRVTAWDALHDVGAAGVDDPADVVRSLEASGAQVRITAETPLSDGLSDRRLDLRPDRIHDLLAFATLYLGEGATMAAESAVLGTPAVYVNTLRMGYTDELEAKYELLVNCQGSFRHDRALRVAERILSGELSTDWAEHRRRLLRRTTDTTDVILEALGAGTVDGDVDEPLAVVGAE